jgi:predicted small secreted protein
MKTSILLLLCLCLLPLTGCTSAIGFGDDNGVGLKSSVGKEGKVFVVEATDGDGRSKQETSTHAAAQVP